LCYSKTYKKWKGEVVFMTSKHNLEIVTNGEVCAK
jgi:hypothetical protein